MTVVAEALCSFTPCRRSPIAWFCNYTRVPSIAQSFSVLAFLYRSLSDRRPSATAMAIFTLRRSHPGLLSASAHIHILSMLQGFLLDYSGLVKCFLLVFRSIVATLPVPGSLYRKSSAPKPLVPHRSGFRPQPLPTSSNAALAPVLNHLCWRFARTMAADVRGIVHGIPLGSGVSRQRWPSASPPYAIEGTLPGVFISYIEWSPLL
ncbi:hypothetical protein BC834DRAFT_366948 [Gloeopeniophorella convolvens]|nr:hypothetical protein BC834DRAFT_366948 [Gloeopeniophorella convolvens]